jgi:hypothetical protein
LSRYLDNAILNSLPFWKYVIYLFLLFVGFKRYALIYIAKNSFVGYGIYAYYVALIECAKPGIKQVFEV